MFYIGYNVVMLCLYVYFTVIFGLAEILIGIWFLLISLQYFVCTSCNNDLPNSDGNGDLCPKIIQYINITI